MFIHPPSFSANGKLLLTGEYFVLDGAVALAVPTRLGQKMEIRIASQQTKNFIWRSFDSDGTCWFEGEFSKDDFNSNHDNDPSIAKRLTEILNAARDLNAEFISRSINEVSSIETKLDFPRQWGLGTSSTLIAMMAQWAKVDPYQLLAETFGGSGYDLACAEADQSLLYQLPGPVVKPVRFSPNFSEQIFFVYLNKKQNSREGILNYRKIQRPLSQEMAEINILTDEMLHCQTQSEFARIMAAHEQVVSQTLKIERAKDVYFSDFPGEIKSLGAWGGDFVMVTSDRPMDWVARYFREKGMSVFKTYKNLIKEDGLEVVR